MAGASADLLLLQNRLKRDPESYRDEFSQQKRHFDSNLQIFQLQAQQKNTKTKEFASLVTFMCHVRTIADAYWSATACGAYVALSNRWHRATRKRQPKSRTNC